MLLMGFAFGCSVGILGVWSVIHPLLEQNLRNSSIKGPSVCGRTMGLTRLFASTPVQGPLHRVGGTHPWCVALADQVFLGRQDGIPPDVRLL